MRLGPSAWGSSSEKIPILPQTCVSRKRCLEAALGEREHVILRKGKEKKKNGAGVYALLVCYWRSSASDRKGQSLLILFLRNFLSPVQYNGAAEGG